ncbi:hypothetical protein [Nitrosomonas supralitoralis]|uniref:hypothetical protein n=1 Tax=Nitrosomonas supralitoralis TaxID=2116706 RepID=UPI0011C47A89|nr:hypothetical protein [Nitrosomonas supralitoralis]
MDNFFHILSGNLAVNAYSAFCITGIEVKLIWRFVVKRAVGVQIYPFVFDALPKPFGTHLTWSNSRVDELLPLPPDYIELLKKNN